VFDFFFFLLLLSTRTHSLKGFCCDATKQPCDEFARVCMLVLFCLRVCLCVGIFGVQNRSVFHVNCSPPTGSWCTDLAGRKTKNKKANSTEDACNGQEAPHNDALKLVAFSPLYT
jgi:hypothetical protein